MGLFGSLFEKKTCDICGEEIGLLGNRKLEDGNCCKACCKKLSPWFSDRKNSTIAEIKEQLAYREENKKAVSAFQVTRTYGDTAKLLFDDTAGKFLVTYEKKWREENPDIIDFSQVTGCHVEVHEDRSEVYDVVRDSNGNREERHFSPRRYRYYYHFIMEINVNSPYFDEINFHLNCSPVKVRGTTSFLDFSFEDGAPYPPTDEGKHADPEYARYEQWGREICETLLQGGRQARAAARTAPPVSAAREVTCPWCGALTAPDEKGCCKCCGGNLDA